MVRRDTSQRESVDVKALRDNISAAAEEAEQRSRGWERHNQQLDDICYPQEGRRHA